MKSREDIHVVLVTNLNVIGSGYSSISAPIIRGLGDLGYIVRVIGSEYHGEEHDFNASLISCESMMEVGGLLSNINHMHAIDVVIVLYDIPIQVEMLTGLTDRPFKYIGIFPVESDPLVFEWAAGLQLSDYNLVISEFGVKECNKVGVNAEYFPVGVDYNSWRPPSAEEKTKLRKAFGFSDDEFIVLTVADNHERKNLTRNLDIFAGFHEIRPNSKYILVTREHLSVGWKLRDYIQELRLGDAVRIFERGLSFKQLWSMYAVSDVFLLASKCEGLGMPLLEAMSVGIPCVGTNCTAIKELLSDGRGYLIDYVDDPDLDYRDTFGNTRRYFAKKSHGIYQLLSAYDNRKEFDSSVLRDYIKSRKVEDEVRILDKKIREWYD